VELAEDVVPVLLAAVGAFFLFREVWIAQTIERLSSEAALHDQRVQHAAEMAELYRTNKREYLIRTIAHGTNRPPDEIDRLYKGVDDAEIERMATDHTGVLASVPQAVERFKEAQRILEESLAPRALRLRRLFLSAGFVALMLSAVLEVAVAVSRDS
jgi:hypothetical protein